MKNKLTRLIEKDGFYIILFICVCVVAVTAVTASRKNLSIRNEDKLSEMEDFIIIEEEIEPGPEPYIDRAQELESRSLDEPDEEEAEETMAITDDGEIENENREDLEFVEEQTVTINNEEEMMAPVEGKVGNDFTRDTLVYSETLEEWTGHKGIDILAAEGTEIVAALSGKVLEVYKDELWGIVIIIDHGDGLMTKYANLSTGEMVQEGITVNKGDVISKVGKTASIEMMMESHIHFEVIKDGINIDPKNYIPALIY